MNPKGAKFCLKIAAFGLAMIFVIGPLTSLLSKELGGGILVAGIFVALGGFLLAAVVFDP